ncbi:hypothetical protein AB0J21_28270 [Streptomyces sp. NPDC049954]|uniref:hypothetical protein n=1 Tax=Streptomyces sp. NPDC049954 TaxID=3155779 RepID=UPI003438F663
MTAPERDAEPEPWPEPEPVPVEFNPMRFPPCACARCREGEEAGDESVVLRRLRERVNEENALRRSIRRQE